MHNTLKILYKNLEEKGNVLTGRAQVAVGDIRNQCKCSVRVIVYETSETNKIEEKSIHYTGYLVTTENEIENDSALFLVVPVYRNRLILDYFEFGFNKRTLFGSHMQSSGNYSFNRKEIKKIELRVVKPGPTGYVDPKILEQEPDFIIVEGIEHLKTELSSYFKNENSINIYLSNNLSEAALAITLKDDFTLSEEKLQEILKRDGLSKDLMGYKITQVLVRSEKTNKILYVTDLY